MAILTWICIGLARALGIATAINNRRTMAAIKRLRVRVKEGSLMAMAKERPAESTELLLAQRDGKIVRLKEQMGELAAEIRRLKRFEEFARTIHGGFSVYGGKCQARMDAGSGWSTVWTRPAIMFSTTKKA